MIKSRENVLLIQVLEKKSTSFLSYNYNANAKAAAIILFNL